MYGAIAWAEEAGIEPDKSFAVMKYMLEEDTDNIPLLEYEFGRDGKHLLMANNNLEAHYKVDISERYDQAIARINQDQDYYVKNVFAGGKTSGGGDQTSTDQPSPDPSEEGGNNGGGSSTDPDQGGNNGGGTTPDPDQGGGSGGSGGSGGGDNGGDDGGLSEG